MDPVSMIVEALIAGASSALKDTAGKAVKEAYDGLKALLVKYWKSTDGANEQAKETEAKVFLENLEEEPETFKPSFEKKLTKIMPNPSPDLIEQAQQLHKSLDSAGFEKGKYTITFKKKAEGVQIGNHNKQKNEFK
jgi:hypothetical protein